MYKKFTYWFPALLTILYLLTLTEIHSEGEDTLSYVMTVSSESPSGLLFHPHHLLYNAFNYVIFHLWKLIGYKSDALIPMQINSVIAAFGCFLVVIRIGKKLNFSPSTLLICLLLVSGTYGFWYYSLDAETYIIPTFFVLLTIYQAIKITYTPAGYSDYVIAGVYTSLAILFHQMHVLIPPAFLLYCLLLSYKKHRSIQKEFMTNAVLYSAVVAGVVGAAYLWVGFMVYRFDMSGFIAWVRGYTSNGLWTPWSFGNIIKSAIGLLKAIFGFIYLFGFSWMVDVIGTLLPNQLFIEEKFIGLRINFWAKWVSLITLFTTVISFTFLIYKLIVNNIRHESPANFFRKIDIVHFLVLLFTIYAVAITVWEPFNIEFWIVNLPILSIILAIYINRADSKQQHTILAAGFTFAISLFVSNFLGNILPQTKKENDYVLVENDYLLQHATPQDLIITTEYINHLYLSYHTQAEISSTIFLSPDAVINRIEKSQNKRVLISSYFIELLEDKHNEQLAKQLSEMGELRKLDDNGLQAIWELKKF